MYTETRGRAVGYWLATGLVAVAFVVPGIGNLAHAPHIAGEMAHLGYPTYFLTILGTWKVLGALAVVVPGVARLKEWAYAGMIFDLTGAAASRAALGDSVQMIVVPLVIAGLVLTSWALRPAGRTLAPGR